jgi:hypothetical protein
MKYLLLIYSNPESWGHPIFLHTKEGLAMSAADRDAMADELDRLITEIADSGELLSVQALADPVTARTVRVRDRVPVVTDGPFVESKEQMAGAFILDCASQERAEEIAGRFPDARFSAVELRPIMSSSGQEM